MTFKETLGRLLGDDAEPDAEEAEENRGPPSHVCQSCGEEYFTDADMEIRTCRNCGGVKVESTSKATP